MKLLPSQKNELFDLVLENGIDPSKITIQDGKVVTPNGKKDVTWIKYADTVFYLRIKSNDIEYCPSIESWIKREETTGSNWMDKKAAIANWIKLLAQQVVPPDKWQLYKEQLESFKLKEPPKEEYFSFAEFEELEQRMNILKEGIQKLGLSKEKLSLLEAKLEQVLEQGKKMRKVNWRDLLIGTLMAYVVDHALSVEISHQLWDLVRHSFTVFFLP